MKSPSGHAMSWRTSRSQGIKNPPRTLADAVEVQLWLASGLDTHQVITAMNGNYWRTPLVEHFGQQFCSTCGQLIAPDWCFDCLQVLWGKV